MRSPMFIASFALICLALAVAAQDATPPAVEHVIPGTTAGSSLIQRVNPVYPPLARQARIQGTVVMEIKISKSGDVESLQLMSGHPMLAPAAVEAVKQWKYKPFVIDGEPAEVKTTIQVVFTIADNPEPPNEAGPGKAPVANPPADAAVNAPERVRVSAGVATGLLISKVNPVYPREAREQRVQGNVIMKVNVDKDGNVETVELVSGDPLLAPAAIDAVRQWKYKPFLLNGNRMNIETKVLVAFKMAP